MAPILALIAAMMSNEIMIAKSFVGPNASRPS